MRTGFHRAGTDFFLVVALCCALYLSACAEGSVDSVSMDDLAGEWTCRSGDIGVGGMRIESDGSGMLTLGRPGGALAGINIQPGGYAVHDARVLRADDGVDTHEWTIVSLHDDRLELRRGERTAALQRAPAGVGED